MPARFPAFSGDDPFDEVLRPPTDESPTQRAMRIQREDDARRVSDAIDESLKQEQRQKKRKKPVKLLLLGQSESGKSTTLRQFQRLYTPSAFREERILWRAVIQLNLVRSIRTILDTLSHHQSYIEEINNPGSDYEEDDIASASASFHPGFFDDLDQLRMRLLPLRHIEALLIAKLVPPNEDEATHLGFHAASYNGHHRGGGGGYHVYSGGSSNDARQDQEVFVRPGTKWKGAVARGKATANGRPLSVGNTGIETQDEPTATLHSCRHDMITLWRDPVVRDVLRRRKVRLEEQPGFFLDDLERVTSLKYLPSDDDVLRARLKTVGVSEYTFEMETSAGRESGAEWHIVDVGGSRSQRQTWIPFFDDVDAIIFLAPISGFDQVLSEDRSVNRLEDSVLLWKMICSNKMLAKVDLVLFLNKCDILDRKLKSGIRLAKYVRSFQERPNDAETVQKYFRAKFSAIQREYSPNPRKFYGFCTSVTDIITTAGILASVRDMVVREHLRKSKLI
ncbi:G-alpha-domain-containing protein [Rickenella mellea]|uniref:G-alpha-domain-containing protein n=1 Tax=Rickenella mellea TaxID=50990 RepID=A0A4Y7Q9V9_9AGAM|nr:G-alpha-domain-containing protein [Rickenella mellea]